MKNVILNFCLSILLIISGAILFYEMREIYQKSKIHYYNKYIKTNGKIDEINQHTFDCYRKAQCNKCIDGSQYENCQYKIEHQILGYCSSNDKLCCQEYDDDDGINNCAKINNHPRCIMERGQCNDIEITISFVISNTEYHKTLGTKCGFNDNKCVDKFINNLFVGEFLIIYVSKSNYNNIYLKNLPELKMKASTELGYGISIIIITFSICCVIFTYYLLISNLYNKFYKKNYEYIAITD